MKQSLFLVLWAFASSVSYGQSSINFEYELTAANSAYTPLENPSLLTDGVWDDPSFSFPIGFDFVFDSKTYQTLGMNDAFNGGILYFDNEENTASNSDFIVAYYSDIIDPGYNEEISKGFIAHETVGEIGQRICKIEWNNVAFYNEVTWAGTANIVVNFQLWLYEGSNDIEWHFGEESVNNPEVHELYAPLIGLMYDMDMNTEEFTALFSIAGDITNPQIDLITDLYSGYPSTLDQDPTEGMVYRLTAMSESETTSIQRSTLESTISVYPTIVQDQITIDVDIKNQEKISIEVVNVFGQSCIMVQNSTQQQTIDMSTLSSGQYFIKASSDKGIWSQKIVKQ